MSDDNALDGGREAGCKFALGDRVRLKNGTGHPMTVMLTPRRPSEADLIDVNCKSDHDGATWPYPIDDLELIRPE
jgi:hypothetical protein